MRSVAALTCNLRLGQTPAVSALAAAAILAAVGVCGCAQSANYENRPFFQEEYGLETHGRKTWFDRLVEVDPGQMKVYVAKDYEDKAPQTIAVLPFADRGSANYILNKVPLTHRNQEERARWAWTDANRLRRAMDAYLAPREFQEANLIQIDTILKQHGIDSAEKLDQVPPQTLGKWLGVDAVVYGQVDRYEAYYAFLVSAYQVGANIKMVSTRSGEKLFAATGSRWDVNLQPAFDPVDIAINSGLSLLQLRDITLARAEDETAREICLRIPRSEKLQNQLIEVAHDRQAEPEVDAALAASAY